MEQEREKLRELERMHYETEQQLETCAPEEEEDMTRRFRRIQEQIEVQRKLFDDLEFQQLEVRAFYLETKMTSSLVMFTTQLIISRFIINQGGFYPSTYLLLYVLISLLSLCVCLSVSLSLCTFMINLIYLLCMQTHLTY